MLETCSKYKCKDCARQEWIQTDWILFSVIPDWNLSRNMTKPTKWLWVQRRLRSLRYLHWRKLGSLAIHWPHSEDWSDWADAQADLSLRWVHTHFVGFFMSWLISASLNSARKCRLTRGCKTTLVHDVKTSFWRFGIIFRQTFDVSIVDRSRTKHFLAKNVPAAVRCFNIKLLMHI